MADDQDIRYYVFPTRVGMNRYGTMTVTRRLRVPHSRGDEPRSVIKKLLMLYVFPTRVGMNRDRRRR